MKDRHFVPSNINSWVLIIVFSTIYLTSMAYANPLSQQQADEMAVGGELILEYYYYSDNIVRDNKIPRVRVYQDGLVLVHYPVYMKRAGYYAYALTSEELQDLVEFIVSEGFFQFNEQGMRKAIANQKGSSFSYQSHAMRVEVTAHPGIKNAGVTALVPDRRVTVHWKNIEADARQYGDSIAGLNGLYRISQRFEELADRAFNK